MHDVAVIGGGPAGATAGRLLAEWGHSVTVLTRERGTSLAESLPPSCRKLFAFLGVLDDVDRAAFFRTSGNTSWWGGSERRVERFPGGPQDWGYQIPRRDFDRLLLELAARAGAAIREALVTSVELETERGCLRFEENGSEREIEARFVLDCTGRAGVLARRGLRRREPRFATLALVAVWRRDEGFDLDEPTHTLVESYESGWAWSIPTCPAERYVAVMVDPTLERADLEAAYAAELDRTRHFRRVLAGAERVSAPWASDASVYTASEFGAPGFLLAGDAASFIDPLSSYGVKKAMVSGWIAAVAVHTSLIDPARAGAALGFFAERERQVYASYLSATVRYFREAAAEHRSPFWTQRAAAEVPAGAWELDEELLRRDPDVLTAFEALRRSPSIRLELAANVHIEPRPAIAGREIVSAETLVGPGLPAGLRILGGVELVPLARIAPAHDQVPDLFDAYNRLAPPAELPNFLGALSVLLGKGILRNATGV